MEDCAHCRIIDGKRDANILVETGSTVAFLDENPAATGHTLVVPKEHRECLFGRGDSPSKAVFETVERVVAALNRTVAPDGVSTFYTSGPLAGQVTHAHVHLVPRYQDDDIQISLARETLEAEDGRRLATQLREHL